MTFCHLGEAQSLREICNGLAASEGKLKHPGIPVYDWAQYKQTKGGIKVHTV
jgi:hypothetical protein